MNFPIPVNMTVDSGEAIQMTVQGDVTVSCVVDLRISPNVQETYDGPYSVTPSESVQTLETAEKSMTDDVTVGAIPADYIGSSVPRKTSADLTASGPTVTAPAGYYAEAASKDVQRGFVRVNNTGITANPSISVGSDGKIRSTVSKVQSVSPYVTAGYVITGTAGNISVSGHSEMQLNTEAGKTVTPTESEQTAVAANKFTTGEVKVAAIPSDYIGSNVPQKSSSDLTVFGPTVTAPSGYYAEAATKSVAVGSARVYDTAIPVTPSISVDNSGKITASVSKVQSVSPSVNAGYVTAGYAGNMSVSGSAELQMTTQAAQTITPTTTDQTIASDTYLTGAQTIKGDSALVGANIVYGSSIFGVAGEVVPLQVSQDPVTNVLSIS